MLLLLRVCAAHRCVRVSPRCLPSRFSYAAWLHCSLSPAWLPRHCVCVCGCCGCCDVPAAVLLLSLSSTAAVRASPVRVLPVCSLCILHGAVDEGHDSERRAANEATRGGRRGRGKATRERTGHAAKARRARRFDDARVESMAHRGQHGRDPWTTGSQRSSHRRRCCSEATTSGVCMIQRNVGRAYPELAVGIPAFAAAPCAAQRHWRSVRFSGRRMLNATADRECSDQSPSRSIAPVISRPLNS